LCTNDFRYDLVICGAGIAGVTAALEAGRAGLKTALVEKTIQPGGLATSGLIYYYLPLCDGNGRQVTFGMAEELLHLSLRYGPGNISPGWRTGRNLAEPLRLRAPFSPASFVLALDAALVAAGVDVWFDTLGCLPVVEAGRVTGLEVENKDGRSLFSAACFIDATGDADLALRAGAPCAEGRNRLAIWALEINSADQSPREYDADFPVRASKLDGVLPPRSLPGDPMELTGMSARQVNRFVLEGRRILREDYARRQAEAGPDGRRRVYPMTLPSMAQFRTTRRIAGRATLLDGQQGQAVPDAVGLVADWRRPGSVWEIPYGALVPTGVVGLLAAGRCISSEGDAWEVTRVIPAAALTGQVAGLAATLAIRAGTTPDRLDAAEIQAPLRARGMPVHLTEIQAKPNKQG